MKKVSESELKILQIIWQAGEPISIAGIIAELKKQDVQWAHRTVTTFLKRMEEKQVVAIEKRGIAYYYYPLVEKEEFTKNAAKKFLKTHFSNSLSHFLFAFTGDNDVSKEELEEIKKWTEKFQEK